MIGIALAAIASHFSMVGFPVDVRNAEALSANMIAYAQQCEPSQLQGDDYLCIVRDKSGAELWLGLRKNASGAFDLWTANPAFDGEGKVDVVVDGDVSPAEWRPFEIRVQARFGGEQVPLILDLANPREAARFSSKAALALNITAFADEISFHDSEAAYYASQADREIKFASNHFIPSGMFAEGAEAKDKPSAHALFAGKILKIELRQNDKGKGKYWWFLVETMDQAILNVVADPEAVKATPKAGGYLAGSFWMSARLANP
jgi:hypothetical protein